MTGVSERRSLFSRDRKKHRHTDRQTQLLYPSLAHALRVNKKHIRLEWHQLYNIQAILSLLQATLQKHALWHVKDWGARIRKYTEIVKDYGGMANGCQLSLLAKDVACRPENDEIMVLWRSLVNDKFQLAFCKLVYGRLMSFSRATRVSRFKLK